MLAGTSQTMFWTPFSASLALFSQLLSTVNNDWQTSDQWDHVQYSQCTRLPFWPLSALPPFGISIALFSQLLSTVNKDWQTSDQWDHFTVQSVHPVTMLASQPLSTVNNDWQTSDHGTMHILQYSQYIRLPFWPLSALPPSDISLQQESYTAKPCPPPSFIVSPCNPPVLPDRAPSELKYTKKYLSCLSKAIKEPLRFDVRNRRPGWAKSMASYWPQCGSSRLFWIARQFCYVLLMSHSPLLLWFTDVAFTTFTFLPTFHQLCRRFKKQCDGSVQPLQVEAWRVAGFPTQHIVQKFWIASQFCNVLPSHSPLLLLFS